MKVFLLHWLFCSRLITVSVPSFFPVPSVISHHAPLLIAYYSTHGHRGIWTADLTQVYKLNEHMSLAMDKGLV